ncbi:MAG: trehalose utilization protein ThuA [Clostridiales bacterium]|nr:trehalose utilization protein ThuA [Clostridiales bacterium]
MIRVTVWNEFRHEKTKESVRKLYPEGMHALIAGFLSEQPDMTVRTATLDEPDHGLTDEVLSATDVLIWWGHTAHGEVRDDIVEKVYDRVLEGMGLIALHSAHASKIFMKLCGTRSSMLSWRENHELERLFIVNPGHPITAGLPEYFEIPQEETYGEYFNIPQPDELVFISWFSGGEVFRSGFTLTRGSGHIFYFRPGHETFPIFHQKEVQTVITNAVRWAAAPENKPAITYRRNIPLPRP